MFNIGYGTFCTNGAGKKPESMYGKTWTFIPASDNV